MPGSTPATSQLDWLISTTAMIVLSWSKATRDLLKSFGWGIRALHQLDAATMVPSPRRLPHTISPVEGAGFEPSVPVLGGSVCRVISLFGLRGIRRRNEGLDSVRLARSGFPPHRWSSSSSGTLLIVRECSDTRFTTQWEMAAGAGFPDQANKFPDGPL